MKIESKVGTILHNDEKIYSFLTDFNNFENLIPADQVSNWQANENECSFEITGLGKTGMKIIEKEPFKLIKISDIESSKFNFFLWIQLKQVNENDTKVKVTIEPQLNQMMLMMVKKPLKQFVDKLVGQMENFSFK